MPTYEYECEKCGKRFSIDQSMNAHDKASKPRCPDCRTSKTVRQLVSTVHVQTSKKS